MVFKDYYKILGLETNRVTIEEIRTAYRGSAKKHHPDLNIGNKLAEERIKDINEAYKILSTPATKRKYDRKWNTYVGSKASVFEKTKNSKQILKNMFFGIEDIEEKKIKEVKTQSKQTKGDDIETEIRTNIYEAFYGLDKKISLKTINDGIRTIRITIPEGIRNGEKIRLIGQGKKSENGGRQGDMFIKINIQDDKKFKLKGYDLYTNLYISPWEAALGTRVSIESIDKEDVKIYIPQGSESGEIIRIQGKGYKKGKNERGDLITEIKIMVPKNITKEEKELFEKLNKVSKFNPRNK